MSELDELPRRLDGLQSDLTGMQLRPADGVRRRAAQRGRRQTAVATIGTLALAGVLGVAALQTLPGTDRGQAPHPATPSTEVAVVSPTASTTAASTTSAPTTSANPTPITSLPISPSRSNSGSSASGPSGPPLFDLASALLPASELPPNYGTEPTPWLKPERFTDGTYWAREEATLMAQWECWDRPVAKPRQELVGVYDSDAMSMAWEVASVAPDEQTAIAAYDRLRAQCLEEASPAGTTIPPGGGQVTQVTDLPGSDLAFQVAKDIVGENGDAGASVVTVLLRGDRLVILQFSESYASLKGMNRTAFHAAAVQAMDRITP